MSANFDEYLLDPRAVRRTFDRSSTTYSQAAAVQGEIRARLLERLDLVKLQPERVLDLGSASGQSSRALLDRYPKSQVVALDWSTAMLREANREQRWLRRFARVAGDAQRVPLRDGTIDLAFSNLMLAWCNDPDAVLREANRLLRVGGLFMFTTFGPDTLKELRDAFRQVDPHTHVHRFIDMHDWGDALMRAGYAEPVMDTERLTVTYPSARALLDEIRQAGGANATLGRRRGLLTRAALTKVLDALDAQRIDGRLAISVEVVYGHAWRAARVKASKSGEFAIPLTAIKRRS
jgi:malonyl-CoA O-methyltransferase